MYRFFKDSNLTRLFNQYIFNQPLNKLYEIRKNRPSIFKEA